MSGPNVTVIWLLQKVEEIREPRTSGGKPQQAPAKFSDQAYAQLEQASSAQENTNRAEKGAHALPAAREPVQPQHASNGGQSSNQVAKTANAPERKETSNVPGSSTAIDSEPVVPAEQRATASDAAPPMQPTSQPAKESGKGPASNRMVCKLDVLLWIDVLS